MIRCVSAMNENNCKIAKNICLVCNYFYSLPGWCLLFVIIYANRLKIMLYEDLVGSFDAA